MSEVDWQAFVFDPERDWIDRLTRLAEKRFPNPSLAGAAYNFAFEKISVNDWAALAGFAHQSSRGAYLRAVFQRALIDYSRKIEGKLHLPAWLKRQGQLWKTVYEMLCLQRCAPEAIMDLMAARGEAAVDYVRDIIRTIRARIPNCGQYKTEIVMDELPEPPAAGAETPEEQLSQDELRSLLVSLAELLQGSAEKAAAQAGALHMRLDALRQGLSMNDEERLILRLVYQDGYKYAAAARALGLPEHTVRRTAQRVVTRLRVALDEAGFDPGMWQDT